MKKHNLSHKELVKLGLYESAHGRSLNQIDAEFHRMGIERKEAIKALKTVDYMKKREERKAAQENQAKLENKDASIKNGNNAKEAAGKKKPSLLLRLIFLALIAGIFYLLYLYFSDSLTWKFLT